MITKCSACKDGIAQPMQFSMAFQPIVNVIAGNVYAYEALVRGPQGQAAGSVLSQVNDENLYAFDQSCRVRALTLASQLGLANSGAMLSINFLPGAVYSPAACIQLTLKTAREVNFPLDKLIFEVTEGEKFQDPDHLEAIAREYKKYGFKIALDDFGAGFANLTLLADISADIVKLDMALTRDLHLRKKARYIVQSLVDLCRQMNVPLVAEGVETMDEYLALQECGIELMQGYLIARPGFETLPTFSLPNHSSAAAPLLMLA